MKKIFTLLVSTVMLSTAFAQYGQRDQHRKTDVYVVTDNKGFDKHDKNGWGGYYFTPKERDMQIAQINKEYSFKIQAVKNKPFMSFFQKKRMIKNLEEQRDGEIRAVIFKFNDKRNQYGDLYKKDNRRW